MRPWFDPHDCIGVIEVMTITPFFTWEIAIAQVSNVAHDPLV